VIAWNWVRLKELELRPVNGAAGATGQSRRIERRRPGASSARWRPTSSSAVPDWSRTVHCIGDLHAGAIPRARLAAVGRDIERLPAPRLHLQIGDATESGTDDEDRQALRFLARLPGPWVTVLGNHDILHNKRSPRDWAKTYDQPGHNFTVDLPFARLIVLGPERTDPGNQAGMLSPSTLSFLDRELARSPKDCWLACHWPLFRTVMGDPHRNFTSAMAAFHAKPDERIRTVLARHTNAKVWLSGHTHSPLDAPGLITQAELPRERSIAAINFSALVGVGKQREPDDPLRSLYLTQRAGRIEVRCRDHRAGVWTDVRGRRVVEVRL
jgi:predicted phosphodiesterase